MATVKHPDTPYLRELASKIGTDFNVFHRCLRDSRQPILLEEFRLINREIINDTTDIISVLIAIQDLNLDELKDMSNDPIDIISKIMNTKAYSSRTCMIELNRIIENYKKLQKYIQERIALLELEEPSNTRGGRRFRKTRRPNRKSRRSRRSRV
jgi:hypothetical protein